MSEAATMNGTARGRYVAPLPEITLSGVPVRLHRAGPSTIRAIRAAVWDEWRISDDPAKHEPRPPVVTVGDITEANAADPDYQKAHAEWGRRRDQAASERVVDYVGIYVIDPVHGIDRKALDRYRFTMRLLNITSRWDANEQLPPEHRDHLVYVVGILIDEASAEEIQALNAWVYAGQAPTESEVRDALQSFRSDVERDTDRTGGPAPAGERHDNGTTKRVRSPRVRAADSSGSGAH